MRYAAHHMTTRPQGLASNAKDPISGLHRPPVHSKLRSKEHMQCMHVPTGALEELDQTTLLLLSLGVLCASHVQAMPKPCGGIDQSLYCLRHDANIGPRITFCEAR